jgi:hypothetical protein
MVEYKQISVKLNACFTFMSGHTATLGTAFKALCGEKNMAAEWWNGGLLRLNEVIVFQSYLLSRMCFASHEVNVKSRQEQAGNKSVPIPIREWLFHYSARWWWGGASQAALCSVYMKQFKTTFATRSRVKLG